MYTQIESDVDRVELFPTDFEIFLVHFDDVINYFFLNLYFKVFEDASEFSASSLHAVRIFSSKFILIFFNRFSIGRLYIVRSSTVTSVFCRNMLPQFQCALLL